MKLRTRLIIAFFVIILVPVIMTSIALVGFGQYQIKSIEEKYGVTDISYESLSNSLQIITRSTQKIYEEMQKQADVDADEFLNIEYLESTNEKLKSKYSYLLLQKEDDLYYTGTQEDISSLIAELPAYGEISNIVDSGVYIGDDIKSYVKKLDLNFSDGTKGTIFIITQAGNTIPQIKTLAQDIIIAIVLILILTAAILTIWIYTGISAPLKKLTEATQHIKVGDLDFALEVQGNDEFNNLFQDFEEMRQQLRENSEEKIKFDRENKELISNISHDLKTPITAVKGYVEGIMDGVADTPEKMDKYIRTIYNKSNEMDRLINELTFYSKIDTNRIPYTFTKINVTDYFDDCIEEVGLELESQNIELSYFNYADKDTLVIADAEQLKRVINNIISNSVKYLDKPKGYISIRVKDVGDFIQVEIEDNGRGIAAKDLPSIFYRFYRTDASRNSSQGGSGIGLSIVKKIIEDHGGKIWASSKLGAGTVMFFVLRKYQEVSVDE